VGSGVDRVGSWDFLGSVIKRPITAYVSSYYHGSVFRLHLEEIEDLGVGSPISIDLE
jgi:hypothetical protein